MMNIKVAVVLLGAILVVQAEYQPSQKAKECMQGSSVDEASLRHLVTSADTVPEDERMEKFFECCYREHLTDGNELVVDTKLTTHTENVFTELLGGKREAGAKLAREALEHCKDEKGDTKGKTAIRVVNCLKTKLVDYKKTM